MKIKTPPKTTWVLTIFVTHQYNDSYTMMAKPMKTLQAIVLSNDPVVLINKYSPKAK